MSSIVVNLEKKKHKKSLSLFNSFRIKYLKDLAVEKFKLEIKLLQTKTDRFKQQISKLDCNMIAYLETHFDEDIVHEKFPNSGKKNVNHTKTMPKAT